MASRWTRNGSAVVVINVAGDGRKRTLIGAPV